MIVAPVVSKDGTLAFLNEPAWRRHDARRVRMHSAMLVRVRGRLVRIDPGFVSDGGSIPTLVWSFFGWLLGHPFSVDAVLAFFLHDWLVRYGKRYGLRSEEAHWVLFVALRTLGVNYVRAGLMYLAVAAFGRRWRVTAP